MKYANRYDLISLSYHDHFIQSIVQSVCLLCMVYTVILITVVCSVSCHLSSCLCAVYKTNSTQDKAHLTIKLCLILIYVSMYLTRIIGNVLSFCCMLIYELSILFESEIQRSIISAVDIIMIQRFESYIYTVYICIHTHSHDKIMMDCHLVH